MVPLGVRLPSDTVTRVVDKTPRRDDGGGGGRRTLPHLAALGIDDGDPSHSAVTARVRPCLPVGDVPLEEDSMVEA